MLASALNCEIDRVDKRGWEEITAQFDDASIDQMWSSAASRSGRRFLSHIVMRRRGVITACCQASILRLPLFGLGVADINWAPLYLRSDNAPDQQSMWELVRAIKHEYGMKRGYLIRISPRAMGDAKAGCKEALEYHGFKLNPKTPPYRTFVLDLSPSLVELRSNLSQNWRRNLNKGQRHEFRIVEGTSVDLFRTLIALSESMWKRKKTSPGVSYETYLRAQMDLPERCKLNIFVYYVDEDPLCAVACSAVGNTGVFMLGASGDRALQLNASYVLHWRMIEWLKEKGMRYYDLGAHNPRRNPGGYQFKLGIAGKNGREETFLGEYLGCFSVSGWIVKALLGIRKSIHRILRDS